MPSAHEAFWENDRYAVIGHSAKSPFPMLSYNALKKLEKTVYPVDPSVETIEGDPAHDDLAALPDTVDAVIIEVPKEETAQWVALAAEAGIQNVWIHMGRETPEALAIAAEKGLNVCTGTCSVQYLRGGFPHNVHRFLRKLSGNW
ncbi:MAG: CoA-binding protein [Deltaproteobacteria bacterium]|nr:CoA-binding protein [Deltaproteobacteria bacterium]